MDNLTFGDVFRFKEKEYIFLASTQEIIYAAFILNSVQSKQVITQFDRQRNAEKMKSNPAYCFIQLRTEEFKDRIAHFARTDAGEYSKIDNALYFDKIGKLNNQDIEEIKREIQSGPVPIRLKELIAEL